MPTLSRMPDPGVAAASGGGRRVIRTPVGPLCLEVEGGVLVGARWREGPEADADPLLDRAEAELAAWFAGELRVFTLPLDPRGSPFQREVWARVAAIPYGQTRRYGALLGPRRARAVGAANAKNPLSIFIPCHRLVGEGLRGYAGGLAAKRWLLELEARGGRPLRG